jgi:5-methyltetrahydropteroyltriglutamate--homocysteine methyltransferase
VPAGRPSPKARIIICTDAVAGYPRAGALGYAEAVNEEVRELFAASADNVQLDEPYLQARPEEAASMG